MATASTMHPISSAAEAKELHSPLPVTKNMAISAVRVGRRPLQGMKALVRMAMSRSRGLWMIRHPMTPQALHPSPMHMVRLCRPWAPAFRKKWSRLKATLGR